MKSPLFIAVIAVFALLASCKKENMGDCFKSAGSVVSETRMLDDFTQLEVEDGVNVYFGFGPSNEAIVETGSNLIDLIDTEVVDGTLYIRNRNTCNWVRNLDIPIRVNLTCKKLDLLISRGFGEIESTDTISQPVFAAEQWEASGTIRLLLNTDEVYLKSHTGPADFVCHGHTNILYAYNSSMGILRLEGVQANGIQVWNRGVGDIYVTTNYWGNIQIDDIGDVYYTGNPVELNLEINGPGQAIPF